jgi:hypothetical protein
MHNSYGHVIFSIIFITIFLNLDVALAEGQELSIVYVILPVDIV